MNVWRVLCHNRRFTIVSTGLLLSRTGDAATSVAMAWFVLGKGGPQAVGVAIVCSTLPRVPMSLAAGHLLDRVEPRLLLRLDNLARGFLMLLLAALVWMRMAQVWQAYLIAATTACLSALTAVGEGLITPALVPDEQLDAANSVVSATWEGATLVGPAAGGLTIGLLGLAIPFVIDAGTFLVMAAASLALPSMLSLRSAEGVEGDRQPFTAGLSILLGLPVALLATAYTVIYLILSGAMEVEFPSLVMYQLHDTAAALGLLTAATGVAGLLGVLLLTPLLQRWTPATWIAVAFAGQGAMLLLLGLVHSLALALPATFLAFVLGAPYYPLERSLILRSVPAALRGRVSGVRGAIGAAGYPIGAALAGPATVTLGSGATFQLIGALLVAMALLAVAAAPFRQGSDVRVNAVAEVSS